MSWFESWLLGSCSCWVGKKWEKNGKFDLLLFAKTFLFFFPISFVFYTLVLFFICELELNSNLHFKIFFPSFPSEVGGGE